MATIRDRITADVVALLAAGSPPAVPERTRTFDVASDSLPSMIVYWTEDRVVPQGEPSEASVAARELDLVIEYRAAGTASLRPDQVADVGLSWIEKKLNGQTKGVNAGQLYWSLFCRRVTLEVDQADHSYVLARVEVLAKYQSRAKDPDTWA